MAITLMATVLAAAALLLLLVRAANRLWWGPRRLERALRAQGLSGTPYRFLYGDLRESLGLETEARAKPMPFSHDIIPRVHPFLHYAMAQYGKISFTWFGSNPRVTITDPELIKEVLSNKSGHFRKPKTNPAFKLLAAGLINYEGEKWVKHRRILNPAFHTEKLKQMLPAFSTCCSELIDKWNSLVGQKGFCELDVWPELQNFTGDVISRTAFGSNFEEGRRIFQLQAEQAELVVQSFRNVIPGYRFLPTRRNMRMKEIDIEVRKILRDVIGKREKEIANGIANHKDVLGLLMESNSNEQHGTSPHLRMTTEEVIEECKLFYFAGQETTSVLLTWTMVALCMHPSWQVRARDEVLDVFGQNKPDHDGLSCLKIVSTFSSFSLKFYFDIY